MECAGCLDKFSNEKLLTLPCQHLYCLRCLNSMLSLALNDEYYYPPKCCGNNDDKHQLDHLLQHLDPALAADYQNKAKEYAIPLAQRIYCASCKNFFGDLADITTNEDNSLVCQKCKAVTCTICKRSGHAKDTVCPVVLERQREQSEPLALEHLLITAEAKGWRRCPKCQIMVERVTGCNHMTCICREDFCYNCGRSVRDGCGCPMNDEEAYDMDMHEVLGAAERWHGDVNIDELFDQHPWLDRHMEEMPGDITFVFQTYAPGSWKELEEYLQERERGRRVGGTQ